MDTVPKRCRRKCATVCCRVGGYTSVCGVRVAFEDENHRTARWVARAPGIETVGRNGPGAMGYLLSIYLGRVHIKNGINKKNSETHTLLFGTRPSGGCAVSRLSSQAPHDRRCIYHIAVHAPPPPSACKCPLVLCVTPRRSSTPFKAVAARVLPRSGPLMVTVL